MIICPHCLQGEVLKTKILRTDEIIKICDECDTIWTASENISDQTGLNITSFMEQRNCSSSWREFDIMDKL